MHLSVTFPEFSELPPDHSQWDTTWVTMLGREFWPISSHCTKENGSLHRWSISGRYIFSVIALVLRSNSYVDSKDWDDLVHAFTESLDHPFPDEMILLLHKDIPGRDGGWSEHVCPITYYTLCDVPRLLLSKTPSAIRTGITCGQHQQQHAEGAMETQPDRHHDQQRRPKPVDTPWKGVAESKETEADRPGSQHKQEFDSKIRINAAKVIQDAYRAYRRHFEQKRASAARKIQAAHRRHLKRKNAVHKEIIESQAQYGHLLHMRSREMEWSKDLQYYLLFRVPLADILESLNTIGAFFQSEKKRANKRTVDPQNMDHGELMKAVDQYRYESVDCTLHSSLMNPLESS
jgi:hypothetical protein